MAESNLTLLLTKYINELHRSIIDFHFRYCYKIYRQINYVQVSSGMSKDYCVGSVTKTFTDRFGQSPAMQGSSLFGLKLNFQTTFRFYCLLIIATITDPFQYCLQ